MLYVLASWLMCSGPKSVCIPFTPADTLQAKPEDAPGIGIGRVDRRVSTTVVVLLETLRADAEIGVVEVKIKKLKGQLEPLVKQYHEVLENRNNWPRPTSRSWKLCRAAGTVARVKSSDG